MALLTLDQQIVFMSNASLGIIHIKYVVDAMAVGANRLIRWLIGIGLVEQFHRRTVEVGYIGIEHIRRDTVLIHDALIGVTFRTQEWRAVAKRVGRWVADVMYAMTIDTSRYKRVACLGQCSSMDTIFICFIDRTMALGTGFGDMKTGSG